MSAVLTPRLVPLGGHRSMIVRRTLPHRDRAFVGAWCFADHYGPEAATMDVAPHPHTGLQTVSWLFEGTIEHRDALGTVELVLPGELNLMTAGRGICHSEVSTTPDTSNLPTSTLPPPTLHGVQLWVVLPEHARHTAPAFVHHVPDVVEVARGVTARVLLGTLLGVDESPVETHTPLLGAEVTIAAATSVTLHLDAHFEHGLLVDTGRLTVDGRRVEAGELALVDAGPTTVTLETSESPARVMLLGGEPFDEEIVMWWNFIGRSHDEIEQFSREWNAEADRFGEVQGYTPTEGGVARIPAPEMPPGRLLPTVRRGRQTRSVT